MPDQYAGRLSVLAAAFLAVAACTGGGDALTQDSAAGSETISERDGLRSGTLAAGAALMLASSERVCTNTHKTGDAFEATLKQAVTASSGVVIPAGSPVRIRVASLSRKENMNDRVEMVFVIENLSVNGRVYPLDARLEDISVEQVRSAGNKDAQKVVGGAAIGAIIGQITGKDTKSTIIGAAAGAVAGTAVAMASAEYDGCIPAEGGMKVVLNQPVTVVVER